MNLVQELILKLKQFLPDYYRLLISKLFVLGDTDGYIWVTFIVTNFINYTILEFSSTLITYFKWFMIFICFRFPIFFLINCFLARPLLLWNYRGIFNWILFIDILVGWISLLYLRLLWILYWSFGNTLRGTINCIWHFKLFFIYWYDSCRLLNIYINMGHRHLWLNNSHWIRSSNWYIIGLSPLNTIFINLLIYLLNVYIIIIVYQINLSLFVIIAILFFVLVGRVDIAVGLYTLNLILNAFIIFLHGGCKVIAHFILLLICLLGCLRSDINTVDVNSWLFFNSLGLSVLSFLSTFNILLMLNSRVPVFSEKFMGESLLWGNTKFRIFLKHLKKEIFRMLRELYEISAVCIWLVIHDHFQSRFSIKSMERKLPTN